jgi:hypothetical protein
MAYNTQRLHEALDLATPAARHRPSQPRFPEKIEPFDYGSGAIVRRVDENGWLSFRNHRSSSGGALAIVASHCAPSQQVVSFLARSEDHCIPADGGTGGEGHTP